MLKLYYSDFKNKEFVPVHQSLYSSVEQALELLEQFSNCPNSTLGIISEQDYIVQMTKYNKFVWNIEIPHKTKKGHYQIFLTPNKARHLIEELYNGFNPLKINGLMFEKNK